MTRDRRLLREAETGRPEPWERQPGEGSRAFAAFQSYRDQPPSQRSLRRLATELGRSWRPLAEWSSRWRWVERTAAWDAEQDRAVRAAALAERKQYGKRLAAAGALMQLKGIAKVRSYVDRIDRDGQAVSLGAGQSYVDRMSISEAVRLIETGSRLEALGRGGLDDRQSIGNDGPSIFAMGLEANPILAALERDPDSIGEAAEALHRLMGTVSEGN